MSVSCDVTSKLAVVGAALFCILFCSLENGVE